MPEEVQARPEDYERISEERTFEVDVVPSMLFKRGIVRVNYRVKADRSSPPVVAPAPARPLLGGHTVCGFYFPVACKNHRSVSACSFLALASATSLAHSHNTAVLVSIGSPVSGIHRSLLFLKIM